MILSERFFFHLLFDHPFLHIGKSAGGETEDAKAVEEGS